MAASMTPEGQLWFATRRSLYEGLRDRGLIEKGSEPGYARFRVDKSFWHRYLRAGYAPFRDRFSAEGRMRRAIVREIIDECDKTGQFFCPIELPDEPLVDDPVAEMTEEWRHRHDQ
jgi:hypothetical protein